MRPASSCHVCDIKVVDQEFLRGRLQPGPVDFDKPFGLAIIFNRVSDPAHPPREVMEEMRGIRKILRAFDHVGVDPYNFDRRDIRWNAVDKQPVLIFAPRRGQINDMVNALKRNHYLDERGATQLRFDLREALGLNDEEISR